MEAPCRSDGAVLRYHGFAALEALRCRLFGNRGVVAILRAGSVPKGSSILGLPPPLPLRRQLAHDTIATSSFSSSPAASPEWPHHALYPSRKDDHDGVPTRAPHLFPQTEGSCQG